jgi:hypothetical protein
LAGSCFFYGVAKAIPTEMPDPPLAALLEPFGELSPTSALWQQVGSSHPYEILLGAAEVAAGLLIFWPRTATLSAMANMLVLQRSSDSPTRRLRSSHWGSWCRSAAYRSIGKAGTPTAAGRAKPELFGIWSVTDFTAGGKPLAQLSTNETRWQRIIFDEPAVLTCQKIDGELVGVPVSLARDLNSFTRCATGA